MLPKSQNPQPPHHWSHPSDENDGLAAFLLNVRYETTETSRKVRKCKTNCRNIEIPILYPPANSTDLNEAGIPGLRDDGLAYQIAGNKDSPMLTDASAKITARAPTAFQIPASKFVKSDSSNAIPSPSLLTIPFELRLEIYSYLLPPQTHTITTQYPSNGLYYSSTPAYSTQSLYSPTYSPTYSTDSRPNLTTYSIRHRETAIYPEILRVCKQTYEEAEPLLYGSKGVVFNFDTYLDAVLPFLQDRSIRAKESIRSIRIAINIPNFSSVETIYADAIVKNVRSSETGEKLREICDVLVGLEKLREVNLVVWGNFGKKRDGGDLNSAGIPIPADPTPVPIINDDSSSLIADPSTTLVEAEAEWKDSNAEMREVEWVRKLLAIDTLKNIELTWSNFGTSREGI